MTSPSNFKNTAGFSFIGLSMIMFTMAMVISIFWFNLEGSRSQSQYKVTYQNIDRLVKAIESYKNHNLDGQLPPSLQNLISSSLSCNMITDPVNTHYRQFKGWCGPYLFPTFKENPNQYFLDGWGQLVQYDQTQLVSCGSNRVCGDEDDIKNSL